jgi:hypothetical protein
MGRHLRLIELRDGPTLSTLVNREQIIDGCRRRVVCSDLLSIEAPARPPEAPRLSHVLHGSTLSQRCGAGVGRPMSFVNQTCRRC